jgi:hypothetical protein
MPLANPVPDFLSTIREPEQVPILGINDAFLDQEFRVKHMLPKLLADEYDG